MMSIFKVLLESDVVDQVFKLIGEYADVDAIHTEDREMMSQDIIRKTAEGWTVREIAMYMKNMEEVDPDLDEGLALRRMGQVKARVMKRLELTAKVNAAVADLNAGKKGPILQLQQDVINDDDDYDFTITKDEVIITDKHGIKIVSVKR